MDCENEEQFSAKAIELIKKAICEVFKYRQQFICIKKVYTYYLQNPRKDDIWGAYHSAIAAGVYG